jgi:hypothetical protein
MDQGRTGRRQHHVGREILIAEKLQSAVANPCGGDQKLRTGRVTQRGEIDLGRQQLAERIEIERIKPRRR